MARGAGDWRNAADAVLYLRRDLGDLTVVLRHAKQRVGRRHEPVWFTLEEVDPGSAVRLVLGGTYSEETGQGAAVGLRQAVLQAVAELKANAGGLYLDSAIRTASVGLSKATARRALDTIRGKVPWPYGPHQGKQAVVTEDRHGKRVFLTLDAAQAICDAPEDDDA